MPNPNYGHLDHDYTRHSVRTKKNFNYDGAKGIGFGTRRCLE